jgi:hypothetical protein
MLSIFKVKDRAEFFRSVAQNPIGIRAGLWTKLPLAAFAGLRVRRLDLDGCDVSLPAGWKTQNPFRSTYFAAQAMAAEMSTGAPALFLIEKSGVKVSSLVTGLTAKFTKQAKSEATFRFTQSQEMKAAIDRAIETGEPVLFTAKSVGTQKDSEVIAEFEITWSFKKKSKQ